MAWLRGGQAVCRALPVPICQRQGPKPLSLLNDVNAALFGRTIRLMQNAQLAFCGKIAPLWIGCRFGRGSS
jgi:hypothetical protein